MTTLNVDDAMLFIIACGVALGILYLIFETVHWRFLRQAEIKSLSTVRELYRRSFEVTRRLVPSKFAKKKS